MVDPAEGARAAGEAGDVVEEAGGRDAGGGVVGALELQQAAARHGAYRWVELRLFELTGSWSAAPGLPDAARVLLFEASAQHAWHAELWEARLPALADVDPDQLTRPPGGRVEAMLARLEPGAGKGEDETTGRRFLVGLARVVLPLLLVSYRRYGQHLVPATDGPTIRALAHVVRDEEEELTSVEALVDPLVESPEAAQEAAEWARALGEPTLAQRPDDDFLPRSEGDFAW
jgi:hypothetical protein